MIPTEEKVLEEAQVIVPVQANQDPCYRFIKRTFDIVLALLAGTVLLIPMIIGDLKEGVKLFDRRTLQLKMSDVATVGSGLDQLNAYEEDLTLIRARERLDVKVKDSAAFVNGRLRGCRTFSA